MNLQGKKVLVTGADGFIGSHLAEALVRQGADVRAFVLYNSFNSRGWLDSTAAEIIHEMEVVAGDIRDFHSVKQACEGAAAVFHLAALIAIPYSYRAPGSYVDTNVSGTLNVVQAARECDVEKVVHTSTSEVYGTALEVPIPENHPLQPQSPYSASKIGADNIALSYYHSFSLPVAVLRPFNTYGPRQSARAVIPTIISQLLASRERISLGAVSPTRDFNFISDMVSAFIAFAEADKTAGEVANAGTGFEISIGEVAGLLCELVGREVKIETDEQRIRPENSEVNRLCASNEKIRRLTGWQPEFSGLDGLREGLRRTVDWFSRDENLKLYKSGEYNI